jgi:hypothetical protein
MVPAPTGNSSATLAAIRPIGLLRSIVSRGLTLPSPKERVLKIFSKSSPLERI